MGTSAINFAMGRHLSNDTLTTLIRVREKDGEKAFEELLDKLFHLSGNDERKKDNNATATLDHTARFLNIRQL